jgi:hypothetical protein
VEFLSHGSKSKNYYSTSTPTCYTTWSTSNSSVASASDQWPATSSFPQPKRLLIIRATQICENLKWAERGVSIYSGSIPVKNTLIYIPAKLLYYPQIFVACSLRKEQTRAISQSLQNTPKSTITHILNTQGWYRKCVTEWGVHVERWTLNGWTC